MRSPPPSRSRRSRSSPSRRRASPMASAESALGVADPRVVAACLSKKNDTGVSKRRPLRDAPAVARPAAAPAPPKQPAMAPKPCAHCGAAIELPPQHALYWRCGACRKVNGRPAYAGSAPGARTAGRARSTRRGSRTAVTAVRDRFAFKKTSRKLQLANVEPCRFISWSLL